MSGSTMSPDSTDTMTNKTINTSSNTISIVEADISDLGTYLTATDFGVGFHAVRTSTQSISNATLTGVIFNLEDGTRGSNDANGDHNSSTGVYTCTKTGKYNISGMVQFAENATGRRVILIYHEGASIGQVSWAGTSNTDTNSHFFSYNHIVITATDTVVVNVYQTSGGSLNVVTANFGISWAGPA